MLKLTPGEDWTIVEEPPAMEPRYTVECRTDDGRWITCEYGLHAGDAGHLAGRLRLVCAADDRVRVVADRARPPETSTAAIAMPGVLTCLQVIVEKAGVRALFAGAREQNHWFDLGLACPAAIRPGRTYRAELVPIGDTGPDAG